jgi:hypothetical protein
MALARPTFLRVHSANGFESTTCTWCVRSIGKELMEEELLALERIHECDHHDLQRFAPAAQQRRTRIAWSGGAIGTKDSQGA